MVLHVESIHQISVEGYSCHRLLGNNNIHSVILEVEDMMIKRRPEQILLMPDHDWRRMLFKTSFWSADLNECGN